MDAGGLGPFGPLGDQDRLKTEILARSMATMDYDAVALGEWDLAAGPAWVRRLVGWLRMPVLATNYALPDSESVRAAFFTVRGRRVGLVSFMDAGMARARGATWLDFEPWDAERSLVDSLRARSDVLVALAQVPDSAAAGRLAELYPGLDVIITAHEGKTITTMYRHRRTAVIGNAAEGRYLGRIEVAFKPDSTVDTVQGLLMPVAEGWGRRKAVDALLNEYYTRLQGLTSSASYEKERLKDLEEPEVEYVGSAACASCHSAEAAQYRTTLHAHAHRTLIDKKQERNPECQGCHTTGYGYRTGFATPASTPAMWNVGCESCHGPGAAHVRDTAAAYGAVTEATCKGCHTGSNSPKFDYAAYRPKIVHAPAVPDSSAGGGAHADSVGAGEQ